MTFQLKFGIFADGRIFSEAINPSDLDFSDLHRCNTWSIWLDDLCVACVDWLPATLYCVGNEFDGAEIIVPHERIIPTIKSILNYNWLFGITKHCYCYPVVEG